MSTLWKRMTGAMLVLTFIFLIAIAPADEPFYDYPVQPVPFTSVQVEDGFWRPRMETNRTASIPSAFTKCEESGRMDNFRRAAGTLDGDHEGGYPFDDTDPYKVAEGASYALMLTPDPELDQYLDDLIALIAAAQEEDGYLYTCRTNGAGYLQGWGGDERYSNLNRSHELYNAGHMYEAAVAHYQATGKTSFLDIATANADLLVETFNKDGIRQPPGHQIIEMGLAKLYRATGERKYLDLAKFLLDVRGRELDGRSLGGPYNQDHAPVIEQDEAVGHAVRATYMYSGMVDVAAFTGDQDYVDALDRIWENVASKKLYITGGVGATGAGEAFGQNYELPNESAYCETCAAIGNVYWNHRMFLLHGDAKYIDVLERTLYNGMLSGVSLDGTHFFYPNPLESHGQHQRSEWFGCACCPGNVTRFIASMPGYVYATAYDQVYVNLYVEGEANVTIQDGRNVLISQETEYPWDGRVAMNVVAESDKNTPFTISFRIPGWARETPIASDLYTFLTPNDAAATITINGEPIDATPDEQGYINIRRVWEPSDKIELELPMPVRRMLAHEAVEADRGLAALQRGPIVYCVEWPEVESGSIESLCLPDDAPLTSEYVADKLGGIVEIRGEAEDVAQTTSGELSTTPTPFAAIPYCTWANRGAGTMRIWLARTPDAALPTRPPTIASRAMVRVERGKGPDAINDQRDPRSSGDHDVSFFHWWPLKDSTEWVEMELAERTTVSKVSVYWFDDTGRGACRVPAAWELFYKDTEGEWASVANPSEFGCVIDQWNETTFDPIETDALRFEVRLPEDFATGIHEIRIE